MFVEILRLEIRYAADIILAGWSYHKLYYRLDGTVELL